MTAEDTFQTLQNLKGADWDKSNVLPNQFFTFFFFTDGRLPSSLTIRQEGDRLFDLPHTPVQHQQYLPYMGLFLLQSCMFLPVWSD